MAAHTLPRGDPPPRPAGHAPTHPPPPSSGRRPRAPAGPQPAGAPAPPPPPPPPPPRPPPPPPPAPAPGLCGSCRLRRPSRPGNGSRDGWLSSYALLPHPADPWDARHLAAVRGWQVRSKVGAAWDGGVELPAPGSGQAAPRVSGARRSARRPGREGGAGGDAMAATRRPGVARGSAGGGGGARWGWGRPRASGRARPARPGVRLPSPPRGALGEAPRASRAPWLGPRRMEAGRKAERRPPAGCRRRGLGLPPP